MEEENLTKEQLVQLVQELKLENAKLKESKKEKREKTTPKEIVEYWEERQDERFLSVDWAEAE